MDKEEVQDRIKALEVQVQRHKKQFKITATLLTLTNIIILFQTYRISCVNSTLTRTLVSLEKFVRIISNIS